MRLQTNGIKISACSVALPKKIYSNETLAQSSPIDSQWTRNILGISERSILSSGETLTNLAHQAATEVINKVGVSPDLIVVATSTPDYLNPSTAAIMHDLLNLNVDTPAFDLHAVCNGFLYGISISASLLVSSNSRSALMVGADQFSKITDFKHRDAGYFGDGAGAVLIERKTNSNNLFVFDHYADGRNWQGFHTKHGGFFQMNGRKVREVILKNVPKAVFKLLADFDLKIEDIDHFVTHQPSELGLVELENALGLHQKKFTRSLTQYGNTAGASIPITLNKIWPNIQLGDKICFIAFGSGWTWSVGIVEVI